MTPASNEPFYEGDFIAVARCFDPIAAELLRGRLEADGIPAILGDPHMVQTYSLWAVALGGVRVMVPSSYAARALRAVAAIEHGELALEDEASVDADAAPREDAPTPPAPRSRRALLTILLLLALGFFALGRPNPFSH